MSPTDGNILRMQPIWKNGTRTLVITYPDALRFDHHQIDRLADEAGYLRTDNIWTPPKNGSAMMEFSTALSRIGLKLDYVADPHNAPFNLERLALEDDTRNQLQRLSGFELRHLSGWTPVQAEGTVDGRYYYFRARGSYWRMEIGGNESGSRSPRWWYEEDWPSKTGFEAGYLSDQEAVSCILKAVNEYRSGDHSRFMPGHPDYERTIIEGWSLGALSLRTVTIRLGITGDIVIERAVGYGIELPYTAQRELRYLKELNTTVHRLPLRTGIWIEAKPEDDGDEDL